MEHVKYQRTYHIPTSLGITNDDKVLRNLDHFIGREVIISEKLDGENTTMYNDGMHARSLSSGHHASRSWVKCLHAAIKHFIPVNTRICGENLFAVHSIEYSQLPSYFMVFGIYHNNKCIPWDDLVDFCEILGLETVPVLYRGIFPDDLTQFYTGESKCGGIQEGFVVRLADEFTADDTKWIAKWVRENHVTTDNHWMNQEIKANKLLTI